ncbi:MAG: type II secretion system protein [Patescibacteria group bacterium]
MLKKGKTGFTLIELLVVISIMGILSTIAVVSYRNGKLDARDEQRTVTLSQFRAALEDYYDEYDAYVCGDSPDAWSANGNYFTVESSGSPGFINGWPRINESGSEVPGDGCKYHNQMSGISPPELDGYPIASDDEDGLADNNYLISSAPLDPINDDTHLYWYAAPIHGRDEFVLWATLEDDPEMMQNDGGECDKKYEVSSSGWFTKYPGAVSAMVGYVAWAGPCD